MDGEEQEAGTASEAGGGSSAARADEDVAGRRQGPPEWDSIYGKEHLAALRHVPAVATVAGEEPEAARRRQKVVEPHPEIGGSYAQGR